MKATTPAGLALVALLLLASRRPANAHGDVHEAIGALTRQIESTPNAADLYLSRGELHAIDQNWKAATADYDQAAAMNPALAAVDLARGELLLRSHNYPAAKEALSRYLARTPAASAGYAARARLYVTTGELAAAAEDFAQAIACAAQPSPALYLEQSRALRAAGHELEAVRALDDGISRLGPLSTLEQAAIDLDVAAQRTDSALARVDRLLATTPGKARWLVRRGEILEAAGRKAEARDALAAAGTEIDALTAQRRVTAATAGLARSIETALARLAAVTTDRVTE